VELLLAIGEHLPLASARSRQFSRIICTHHTSRICAEDLRLVAFCVSGFTFLSSVSSAQRVPIFRITPEESSITFNVGASASIQGTFDTWNANLRFASPDVTSGVLDVEIQAASIETGRGLKNSKLKGGDFFDVVDNPSIKSTVEQSGPNSFNVDGNFTIRGVTKPEKLRLLVTGKGTDSGTISATMAFDRKNYAMNSGIPFIRIADRVEVTVSL
jgi:polyisoprenoid-binding protein YceI